MPRNRAEMRASGSTTAAASKANLEFMTLVMVLVQGLKFAQCSCPHREDEDQPYAPGSPLSLPYSPLIGFQRSLKCKETIKVRGYVKKYLERMELSDNCSPLSNWTEVSQKLFLKSVLGEDAKTQVAGPGDIVRSCGREVYVGYYEKILHPEVGWALEQAPQGSGHSPSLTRVQEVFGQRSWVHGVTLGDGPVQCQELDLMSLLTLFQFSLFCDSVIL
ncbi:hypothetical protein TURU_017691 [Turdus rufiventris]|nr:hypothetical protein TURU_017691 [Turdus rufiventris]